MNSNNDNQDGLVFKLILIGIICMLAWCTMAAAQGLIWWEIVAAIALIFFICLVAFWIVDINKTTSQNSQNEN